MASNPQQNLLDVLRSHSLVDCDTFDVEGKMLSATVSWVICAAKEVRMLTCWNSAKEARPL